MLACSHGAGRAGVDAKLIVCVATRKIHKVTRQATKISRQCNLKNNPFKSCDYIAKFRLWCQMPHTTLSIFQSSEKRSSSRARAEIQQHFGEWLMMAELFHCFFIVDDKKIAISGRRCREERATFGVAWGASLRVLSSSLRWNLGKWRRDGRKKKAGEAQPRPKTYTTTVHFMPSKRKLLPFTVLCVITVHSVFMLRSTSVMLCFPFSMIFVFFFSPSSPSHRTVSTKPSGNQCLRWTLKYFCSETRRSTFSCLLHSPGRRRTFSLFLIKAHSSWSGNFASDIKMDSKWEWEKQKLKSEDKVSISEAKFIKVKREKSHLSNSDKSNGEVDKTRLQLHNEAASIAHREVISLITSAHTASASASVGGVRNRLFFAATFGVRCVNWNLHEMLDSCLFYELLERRRRRLEGFHWGISLLL